MDTQQVIVEVSKYDCGNHLRETWQNGVRKLTSCFVDVSTQSKHRSFWQNGLKLP